MTDFAGSMVDTPRLRQQVWTSGPVDGTPHLLIPGNITTGGFWRYVARRLSLSPYGFGGRRGADGRPCTPDGGRWREVVLDGVGHGIPLEVPDVVAAEIEGTMADA